MALKFGLLVPQGWTMDLARIKDPVEAYETMTRVAQMESQPGRDTTTWSFFQVATRQMDSVCGHLMKYNMKAPDDERNRT